ncbi:MAG: amidase [Acidimicrobiales bacterium]
MANDHGLPDLSALELAARIRSREVSPLEALEGCLTRVDQRNQALNAVIWREDDTARAEATRLAQLVMRSDPEDLPPFCGVPIPIKDLTPVAGWPVTYGSWAAPAGPSAESELVVEAFQRAGFVLCGRTNTPEFGPITAAENLRYGISRNPWDLRYTPGGSSGGAAAATAGGLFPIAHGNDGGGSIRIPASCCGLVGLKVSRGRIPTRITFWEGSAVEGVLTHDVADTAAVLDIACGPDPGSWYNAPKPARSFLSEMGTDPGVLRVGVLEEPPLGLGLDDACREAVQLAARTLEALGHHVAPAQMELAPDTVVALLNIINAGLADYMDIDWERTEPHIQAGRAAAQAIDSLLYVRSVHDLQRFSRTLVARWGQEFDVLLTPTMTIPPPPAGSVLAAAHQALGGPALPVLQMAAITSTFNITGQPAISLPLSQTPGGLPIGVQLVAGPWEEALLLRLAAQLEQALPWSGRRPSL